MTMMARKHKNTNRLLQMWKSALDLDHDGALLPVQLKVHLPHPVLVHLRRDGLEAVENPREAIIYCGEMA